MAVGVHRVDVNREMNNRPRHGIEQRQHRRVTLGQNVVCELGHRAQARDTGQRTVSWRPDWGIRLPPSPPHSSRFNEYFLASCLQR